MNEGHTSVFLVLLMAEKLSFLKKKQRSLSSHMPQEVQALTTKKAQDSATSRTSLLED